MKAQQNSARYVAYAPTVRIDVGERKMEQNRDGKRLFINGAGERRFLKTLERRFGMRINLVSKWSKSLAACCLCVIVGAPFVHAKEITPADNGWTTAAQMTNVEVQIIPVDFKKAGNVAKNVRRFYVAVWLRNTSDKPVTVPTPGCHASDSVIHVLNPERKPLLSPGWAVRPAGSNSSQLAAHSTRVFCVNVFSQECYFLPENALKKGRHTVEFLGCKVSFEVDK